MLLSTFNRVGGERVIEKVKGYFPLHISKKDFVVKLVNKAILLTVNNALLTLVLTVFRAGIDVRQILERGSPGYTPTMSLFKHKAATY
jgi:hypothetical protein